MGFLSGIGDAIDTGISGVGKFLGSITGATQAAEGGEKAAEIQAQYGREAMKQQQQQFETLMRLLSPYQQVGIPAAQRLAGYERELAPTGISAIQNQLIPQLMQAYNLAQVTQNIPGASQALQQAIGAGQAQQAQLGYLTSAGPEALAQQMQYAQAGQQAMQQQAALSGAAGPRAQQAAIAQIEQSPEFQAIATQGENAILQNAAATGGLRGGRVQQALAQYRPQLLNQFIQQKYQQLGGLAQAGLETSRGLTSLGATVGEAMTGRGAQAAQNLLSLGTGTAQNLYGIGAQAAQNAAQMGTGFGQSLLQAGQAAAAGQAASSMQQGQQIGSLLGQIGAAEAGGELAQGARVGNLFQNFLQLAGAYSGGKLAKAF